MFVRDLNAKIEEVPIQGIVGVCLASCVPTVTKDCLSYEGRSLLLETPVLGRRKSIYIYELLKS